MTITDIRKSIALQKEAGHSSRVAVPIVTLEELVKKAEAYDKILYGWSASRTTRGSSHDGL